MPTATSNQKISGLYAAFFNRAPDQNGLNGWNDAFANGSSLVDISEQFVAHDVFTSTYGGMSNQAFIEAIYTNMLGGAGDTAGIATWVAQLDAGVSKAKVVADFVETSLNIDLDAMLADGSLTQADYDAAVVRQAYITNRADVGLSFAEKLGADSNVNSTGDAVLSDPAYLASLEALKGVDGTAASKAAAETKLDDAVETGNPVLALTGQAPSAGTGTTFTLTESQDNLAGTDKDDAFNAYVFDNQNTLQSGDMVDGGAGLDTLTAVIGNSQAFAITPVTQNVEIVEIRAQSALSYGDDNADNEVVSAPGSENSGNIDGHSQFDAQDMKGVQEWWSVDSRANLVIEDVRSNSHQTKIGVRNTDAGDVNYEVYFDDQHVTANDGTNSGDQVFLDLLDQLHAPDAPLQQHPYKSFSFVFNGQTYTVDNLEAPNSYVELETLVRDQIGTLGLSASLEVTRVPGGFQDNNGVQGDRIVISSKEGTDVSVPASGSFTTGDSKNSGDSAVDDVYFALNDQAGVLTPALTSTGVELDNVGRGSKAGDVVIGNMSMLGNTGEGTTSGSDGIQQFDVEVDRSSWINELRSTGDQEESSDLEVVNVINIAQNNAAGDGDLQIDVLKDVRVFDAATMAGDVALTASLSEAVTAKYMNLVDTAVNSAADNSETVYRNVTDTFFSYDMGNGDDTLNLTLSEQNLEDAGTTTREDFVLEVNGGNGNDALTVEITDPTANTGDFWYANHQENSEIVVNGGAGNDTIRTPGAGDLDINAGSGDDTVYSDNSGAASNWVVNATNTDVDGLDSAGTGTEGMLFNASLTVTYAAANGTNAAGMTQPQATENVVGFESKVTVTSDATGDQRTVNQAIKKAINEDAVLSKLLVAKDGPAHTLVITSLVDGTNVTQDISFNVEAVSLASLSDSQQATLQTAYEKLTGNSALTLNQGVLDAAANAYDGSNAVLANAGTASIFESNNVINVGSGNDVVVLSTGTNSNETVEFTGTGLGNVTLVNFDDDAGSSSEDTLDFSAYLTGMTSASGSTQSQAAIADTYEMVNVSTGSATASADEILVINDFAGDVTTGETWSALNAANLLAALRDDNTTGFGNIANGDINVAAKVTDFVGNTVKNIIMVENDANQGEYKVFEVTSDLSAGVNEFTAATLISTVDFGASFNQLDDAGGVTPTNPTNPTNPGNIVVDQDLVAVDGTVETFEYTIDSSTGNVVSTAGGDFSIAGFTVGEDAIVFTDVAAGTVTTGTFVSEVTVSSSGINNLTDVIFDADANGDANQLTLVGVVDGTLSTVDFSVA